MQINNITQGDHSYNKLIIHVLGTTITTEVFAL